MEINNLAALGQAGQIGSNKLDAGGVEDANGSAFSDLLAEASQEALKIGQQSDREVLNAAQGQVDLTNVISAVSSAEITLQGIVAVRDKAIAAYQEIMRMPI